MSKLIDETGNIYSRLLVIEQNISSKSGGARWTCLCQCGNITIVAGQDLRRGNTKSCGCLSKERISERSKIDELNNVYGKLTVIDKAPSKVYSDGKCYAMWLCKCECGNTCMVKGSDLRRHSVQSCGCIGYSIGEANIAKILKDNEINFEA